MFVDGGEAGLQQRFPFPRIIFQVMGEIDQQVFIVHILFQMGFGAVQEQMAPGIDALFVPSGFREHQVTQRRVILRAFVVEADHVRPDVDVQVGGEVHDLRIQVSVFIEKGCADLRFPVFAVNQGVALGDQQLGRVGGEGGAFLFRRQYFQPVFDGKDGQQLFRRFGIGFRVAQEVPQQGFQRDMDRHHQGILERIFRRRLVGHQEDHIVDDDVGRGKINIFRYFLLLQRPGQVAFLDDDRRQGRPEDAQLQPFLQQPAFLGGGTVLQHQQGDGLAPAFRVAGQEP